MFGLNVNIIKVRRNMFISSHDIRQLENILGLEDRVNSYVPITSILRNRNGLNQYTICTNINIK